MTAAPEDAGFDAWVILEIFGHRKLAGHAIEVEMAGGKMLRIDVPGPDGATVATQFYGASAIFCLTPVTEEIARRAAANWSAVPPVTKGDMLPPPPERPKNREPYDPEYYPY